MQIDVSVQQVRFGVADMAQFDEQQLKDAFKKKHFDKIEVLSKAKT